MLLRFSAKETATNFQSHLHANPVLKMQKLVDVINIFEMSQEPILL
jgi:hypothetical protein